MTLDIIGTIVILRRPMEQIASCLRTRLPILWPSEPVRPHLRQINLGPKHAVNVPHESS